MNTFVKTVFPAVITITIALIGGSSSRSSCTHDEVIDPAAFFTDIFNFKHKHDHIIEEESHSFIDDNYSLPFEKKASETSSGNSRKQVTLIELGSENCAPCRRMHPVLDRVRLKFPDSVKVMYYDVSTAEGKPHGRALKVKSLPTLIFFDVDNKEYSRHEGFLDFKGIERILIQGGVK